MLHHILRYLPCSFYASAPLTHLGTTSSKISLKQTDLTLKPWSQWYKTVEWNCRLNLLRTDLGERIPLLTCLQSVWWRETHLSQETNFDLFTQWCSPLSECRSFALVLPRCLSLPPLSVFFASSTSSCSGALLLLHCYSSCSNID